MTKCAGNNSVCSGLVQKRKKPDGTSIFLCQYHFEQLNNTYQNNNQSNSTNQTPPESETIFCKGPSCLKEIKKSEAVVFAEILNPSKKYYYCSQSCRQNDEKRGEEKFNFTCSNCQKGGPHLELFTFAFQSRDDKKFCSRSCAEDYQRLTCDNCKEKCYSKAYYNDISNKTGTLCVKCHWERKKSNNQNQNTEVPEKEAEKSSPSISSPVSSSPHNDNDKNNSNNEPTSPNKPSSPSNSPSSPSPSQPNDKSERCWLCERLLNNFEEHAKQSPSCGIAEEAFRKIDRGETVSLSNLNITEKAKTALNAIQDIKIHKKWVDIDKLDLPKQAKDELKSWLKQNKTLREKFFIIPTT